MGAPRPLFPVFERSQAALTILLDSSGSPALSRGLTSRLTTLTHGRCFALKYRLSPQHPFPSALLDLLLAYLTLLHPPAGPTVYHSAIPARNLVLTGDSVGANLCLGLLQTILSLARQQSRSPPILRWNGNDVALHLPGGVALISPWIDPTYSLPSFEINQKTDYIPLTPLWEVPGFPQCNVWPTDPPRGDLYCDTSCLVHPLVNPAAVEVWRGGPSMLVVGGEEVATDGIKIVVKQAHEQGVKVRWRQFEGLPHVFISLMSGLEHSRVAVVEWARFCREVVEDRGLLRSEGEFIHVRELRRRVVKLSELRNFTREKGLELMTRGRAERKVCRREVGEKSKL